MMMKKLIPAFFYSILILLSHAGECATNGSEITASEKSAPALLETAQSSTDSDQAAPAKPVAAPAVTVAPAKPVTIQPAPAKPASAPVAPVKPATAQTTPAKSDITPVVSDKPVPASAIPKKPIHIPVVRPVSAPASAMPAKPVHTPPAPPLKTPLQKVAPKPAPASGIHAPAKILPTAVTNQTNQATAEPPTHTVDIEVFIREGCLNCAKATEFLDKLKAIQPRLKINIRDVRKEPAALELLKRVAQNQGDPALEYPAFVVGGQLIIGFSEEANTAQQILDNLPVSVSTSDQPSDGIAKCETGKEPSCGLIPVPPPEKPEKMNLNLFGHRIPLSHIGLPLFTVAMGLLDGLNHGSTWVLVLMISLLAPLKDRTRMFTVAGTFIAVQTLLYFILMAVWYNLFSVINISRIAQMVIAGIALLAGIIYFKNYLYFGQKLSLSSHEIAKPGIYTHIRKIVQAQTLIASLLGTIALAIFVQISEFTYTSVFPALYSAVLTMQKLGTLHNYGYLALYDLAYMLDSLIILAIAVITLNPVQSRERKGSRLLLTSSLVLAGLGIYILQTQFLVI